MALHPVNITGPAFIDDATAQLRVMFAAELKVGERIPSQANSFKVLGLKGGTYSKIVRRLAQEGLVTRIPHGVGYVFGQPEPGVVEALIAAHKQKHRDDNHVAKARTPAVLAKALNSRKIRHEIQLQCIAAIQKEGIAKHLVQALRDHDLAHMQCVERALRLIGADFEHSEEAQEMLNKQMTPALAQINFSFSIADKPKAIEAEVVEVPDN